MPISRMVFISDVHIGIDAVTNWYQRAFHEPMLIAAFEWVIGQGAAIDELILLGDVVDQWCYRPDVQPPSFAAIRAANPAILGSVDGAIARALDALGGKVTWVAGNHDLAVGADDVATIVDSKGRSPTFVTDFPYLPAAGAGEVACAHGHQFSVFNAPDPETALAPIPLGHVVTRLSSLWSVQHLTAGQTVIDRAGSGEPSGWPFDKVEAGTIPLDVIEGKATLPDVVVRGLLKATGTDASLPITMLDGSVVTAGAMMAAYGDLYHRFANAKAFPGAGYGDLAHLFALTDTDLRNTLAHFASEVGKRGHRVVVFGHTHAPADAQQRPMIGEDSLYGNSGFNCPARPDFDDAAHPRRPTFLEVVHDSDARRLTVNVHAVTTVGGKADVMAPPLETASIGY